MQDIYWALQKSVNWAISSKSDTVVAASAKLVDVSPADNVVVVVPLILIVGTRDETFERTPTRPVYNGVFTVSVWTIDVVVPARARVAPLVVVARRAVVVVVELPAAARDTVERATVPRDAEFVAVRAMVPALRPETVRDATARVDVARDAANAESQTNTDIKNNVTGKTDIPIVPHKKIIRQKTWQPGRW